MKIPQASNILGNIDHFEALCASFADLSQSLMSEASYPVAADGISLANAEISKLRAELDTPRYSWHGIKGNLVANDYFAIGQIFEANGGYTASGQADEKGRILVLTLSNKLRRLDEVPLLTELEHLGIDDLGRADPFPLVNCPKLTSLRLGEIGHKKKLESVLEMMPWLSWVTIYGYGHPAMSLDWARDNRELETLYVSGLGITELSPLASCVNLKILGVPFNPISSLAPIKELSCLESLNIRYTGLSELWSLCELNNLVTLIISSAMTNLPGYAECKEAIERRGGQIVNQN